MTTSYQNLEATQEKLRANIETIHAQLQAEFRDSAAFAGPSKSQDMLYFSNTGGTFINPEKSFRIADRGGLKDRVTDHFMDGYKASLTRFLEEENK